METQPWINRLRGPAAALERARRCARAFVRHDRAAAGVYIALAAPVLFGATALAFDLSRLMTVNTQLQNAADAAALAAAGELNGQAGAISRATAAACGAFGTNVQNFATGAAAVQIQSLTFMSSLTPSDPPLLPPNPANPDGPVLTSTTCSQVVNATQTQDQQAQFVFAVVQTRSIANTLIQMVGGPAISNTVATATAGFQQTLCNIVPLMICNPLETTPGAGFNPPVGSQILIHQKGSNAQWGPGVYGFLDPPNESNQTNSCVPNGNNQGTPDVTKFLAMAGPMGCTTQVTVRPGNPTPAPTGLNVRFDLFPKTGGQLGGNAQKNACYAPAPDVTKGYQLSKSTDPCSQVPVAQPNPGYEALPLDNCLITKTCATPQLGDGKWDINKYWQYNHGGTPPAGLTTRYSVYQYELANNLIPKPNLPSTHFENGAPACYSGPASAITAARRTINVAIVDCVQQNVNGRSTGIQPAAVVQGFLTNPANSNGDVYIEVEKVFQPNGADSIIHTTVQLYR